MLTSEQSIVVYDRGRAIPDRLTRSAHGPYLAHAERMLAVYREGVGRTRGELHRAVWAILQDEPDCEVRRLRAFAKLLDDAGRFDTDPDGKASKLRLRVFEQAAKLHPLVGVPDRLFETGEETAKAQIARELGRAWPELEAGLYADVIDHQPLRSFEGYPSPEALLSRYNVAQLQAALYRALRMEVTARADFKTILRYLKLSRLLHEVRKLGASAYRIDISGPLSILQETRRYGVNLARFLPPLLVCKDWEMSALLRTPWGGQATLSLSSRDGFRSHLPPPEEFDSTLEQEFALKFGADRGGWTLHREAEIVHEGQTAFIPDFVFRHEDGTEVLFEIVGYWTPEYLEHKRETLRRFRSQRIVIAVPAKSLREKAKLPAGVVVYKTALKVEPVLEALERARIQSPAPHSQGRPTGPDAQTGIAQHEHE
jgi:predicted nuclease of restriction endonuclease-like RecB superfamily